MTPARILVADDDDHVRKIVEFRLRMFGYEVLQASNGREALEIAKREQPDLVLMDAMMPEMDGFQSCGRLKQDKQTAHIPVLMVTAKAEAKDVARAFTSGAVDYVVKPYDPLILEQKISDSLQKDQGGARTPQEQKGSSLAATGG